MFWKRKTTNEDKKNGIYSYIWLLIPIAGLVLEAGYEPVKYAKFSFLFTAMPLLVFIYLCKSKGSAFWGGLLAGLIFFAATLRWFLAVFPLYWMGIENDYFGASIVLAIWLLSALPFALGIALFSLSFYFLKKNSWHDLYIAPSLWIIFEYIRPYFFEAVWWSPDGMFGSHWTNGVSGYLLTDFYVSKMAKITGLFGLSFFVIFLNLLVLFIFAGKKIIGIKKTPHDVYLKLGVAFVLILFIFVPLIFWRNSEDQNGREIYVSSLQLGDKSEFYTSDLDKLSSGDTPSARSGQLPHMVLFPEDTQLLAITGPKEKLILNNLFGNNEASLLITNAMKKRENVIIFKNGIGETLAEQKKEMLIPFGEYLPVLATKAMKAMNADLVTQNFESIRLVTRSREEARPYISENFKIGALSCSGVLSNILYRKLALNGAEILVNEASYEIFNDDPFSFSHVLTAARMRAIENDKYFAQSSASADSFMLDNNGNIIIRGEPGKNQFVDKIIYARSNKNFFVRFGNWVIILSLIIVLIRTVEFAIITMRKKIKATS